MAYAASLSRDRGCPVVRIEKPDRNVCLGVIVGAHGVRGKVRIHSFTADPQAIAWYGDVQSPDGRRYFRVAASQVKGRIVVASLSGVDDRETAQALKGMRLYVPRGSLPEPKDGECYHADLIGLRAEREDATVLGVVVAVQNFGSVDLLEIGLADTPPMTAYVPFTHEAVPVVDLHGKRVIIAASVDLDEQAGKS